MTFPVPEPPEVAKVISVSGAPLVDVIVKGACGSLKASDTVAVAVPEVEPVAVMVMLPEAFAVGVPDITPVDVFRVSPAGRVPADTA